MSGKIELRVRRAKSKDSRYNYYPECFLEVHGENHVIATCSPSHLEICKLLLKFYKHEVKVDATRKRRKYSEKFIELIEMTLEAMKSIEISSNCISEPIYRNQKND